MTRLIKILVNILKTEYETNVYKKGDFGERNNNYSNIKVLSI